MRRIALVVLFLSVYAVAQKNPLFDLDYARFAGDDTSGIVEIYYSFYQNAFSPVEKEGTKIIIGAIGIYIENLTDGTIQFKREYNFNAPLVDSIKNNLTGVLRFRLKFGDYKFAFSVKDMVNDDRNDTAKFSIQLKEPAKGKFHISDIEVATKIEKSDNDSSTFFKNTFEVVPNVATVFGENLPVVFYYVELYNLNKEDDPELLILERVLTNDKNEEISRKRRYVPRKNSSIVEANTINISKLPTGTYNITVALFDSLSNEISMSTKKIFVFNSSVVDTVATKYSDNEFLSSEFATMSEEEIEEAYEQAKYIISKGEEKQWDQLKDIETKRNFLFNFWRNRDADPNTAVNEFKREYYKRIEYANQAYSSFQRKGWRTDRGRVHIVYGRPSEIDRYPSQLDSKPYEIWRFDDLEGGVEFVFGDISGFGDYKLLHSTKRGELRDDAWKNRVQTL
ncbi:hypothetical protein MASR2M39_11220 [Ignavibacteriales bacterium]